MSAEKSLKIYEPYPDITLSNAYSGWTQKHSASPHFTAQHASNTNCLTCVAGVILNMYVADASLISYLKTMTWQPIAIAIGHNPGAVKHSSTSFILVSELSTCLNLSHRNQLGLKVLHAGWITVPENISVSNQFQYDKFCLFQNSPSL